jgi:hypothetical protein
LETQPTDVREGVVERVRWWYLQTGPVAKTIHRQASLWVAGYSHIVQLRPLNFELAETSISTVVLVSFGSYSDK